MDRDRMRYTLTALRDDPAIAYPSSVPRGIETAYDDIRSRYDTDVFLEARVAFLVGDVDIHLPHVPDHHIDLPADEEEAFYETLRHEEDRLPRTDTWFDRHLDRALPVMLTYDDEEVEAWYERTREELDRRGYPGDAVLEEIGALGARLEERRPY